MLRQQYHLKDIAEKFSGIWKLVDQVRFEKRKNEIDWPEWCFIPISMAVDILLESIGLDIRKYDINSFLFRSMVYRGQRLAALAAWRVTQGIYQFDIDLFNEIIETPMSDKLPVDIFYSLPEWCVYIELPECKLSKEIGLLGFYSHLEWSLRDKISELRFLLDFGDTEVDNLSAICLPLKYTSLKANLSFFEKSIKKTIIDVKIDKLAIDVAIKSIIPSLLKLCLPPLLYLCSKNADIRPINSNFSLPQKPVPKKTKKGFRFFPPSMPTIWKTGFRVGAVLRREKEISRIGSNKSCGGVRKRPIPHIRRAHWHQGSKKSGQKLIVKWIYPVYVNFPTEEKEKFLTPVVRKVTK